MARNLHSNANVIETKPQPEQRLNNPNKKYLNKDKNLITKKTGHCYVCGKIGLYTYQCRNKSQKKGDNKNPPKANLAEGDEIITNVVVSKVKMVAGNNDWVIDSRATKHICGDKNSFFYYTLMREGEEFFFLGDSRSTSILGKGKVLLKLIYGKTLSLNNALHVPEIRYNLVSIFVLGKAGVKVSFESDKIVMTKNGVFVGKGYLGKVTVLGNSSSLMY